MSKFFVKTNQIKEPNIEILGADVNHIKNVLRKNIGEELEICNKENSNNYIAKIEKIENDCITCKIIKILTNASEKNVQIHILQGLPKADKMELVIQKSVELGAYEITPIAMKRCIVKINAKDESKKIQRWQKISEVAAKQCGRNIVPKTNNIKNIKEVCSIIKDYDIVLVAYEKEKENKLKTELQKIKDKTNVKIAVIIGPEGGIEPEEVQQLQQNGAKVVTLGTRILRTETVALSIISNITYELEF